MPETIEKRLEQRRKIREQSRSKHSATKPVSEGEPLREKMGALGHKIGEMDPDDPKRHEYVNELCAIGLHGSLRSQTASD